MISLKKMAKLTLRLFKRVSYKKNVFNTNNGKKVLICYIARPFFYNYKISHTNIIESKAIAKLFDHFGFQVDVIDFNSKVSLDISKYSCIFGFGDLFEQSFYNNTFNGQRIYYSTGAFVDFQNSAEIARIKDVNEKYNISLLPKRIISKNWCLSTSFSDHLIILGNEWTKGTFLNCRHKSSFTLNASAFKITAPINRTIDDVSKCFLWFGGSGLVHKGLDLCLEYFSKKPEFKLHICGPIEKDFFEIFKKELTYKNIHFHGFIDVNSKTFIDIVSNCMFTIMPSCSEGQSTALLTTMGIGLIPIASKFCGVTIKDLGIELDSLSISAIEKAIQQSQDYSIEELCELSKMNINYIHENHSIDAFAKNLSQILETIL